MFSDWIRNLVYCTQRFLSFFKKYLLIIQIFALFTKTYYFMENFDAIHGKNSYIFIRLILSNFQQFLHES